MKLKKVQEMSGQFLLVHYGPNGAIKDVRHVKNTIVTVGKNFLANWLTASQTSGFMRYQGTGTGSTGAAAGDTDLETPLPTRVAGALSNTNNVLENQASFGPGVNTGAWTEAGMFSASSGGTLFARQTFGVVTKETGDTIVITWQITFS